MAKDKTRARVLPLAREGVETRARGVTPTLESPPASRGTKKFAVSMGREAVEQLDRVCRWLSAKHGRPVGRSEAVRIGIEYLDNLLQDMGWCDTEGGAHGRER